MGFDSPIVVVTEPADDHDIRQQTPPLQHRIAEDAHFFASRFFPWSADSGEVKIQDVTRARYIPWLSLFALLASASSILCSWIVLHVIEGRPQIQASYLKPASWLSAILSANSGLLHIALSEDVTTAWWVYSISKECHCAKYSRCLVNGAKPVFGAAFWKKVQLCGTCDALCCFHPA